MNAICFAAVGFLGAVTLKQYALVVPEMDEEILVEPTAEPIQDSLDQYTGGGKPDINLTGRQIMTRSDFHFLFWPFMICSGLQLMYQNNVGVYLKSFDQEQYTTLFTTLNPIAQVVCKFIVGFISDIIVHRVPRSALLLLFYVLQTIVMTLCVFFSDSFVLLLVTLIIVGFANGALWCLTPTIVSELYGMKYFGRNWGTIMIGSAFGGLGCQQIFGQFYDMNIHNKNSQDCFGKACFTWSFIIAAVFSFCSCMLAVGLIQGRLDVMRKEKANGS